MKNYYYYNEEQCQFLPVEYSRKEQVIHHTSVLIFSGSILSALLISLLSSWVATPAEMALQQENRELFSKLEETRGDIQELDREMEEISRSDNELYRTMLGVDPIPEEERRAGAGGGDMYSEYDVFQEETSELLQWTAETVESLKRRINIQKLSFEEIKGYYSDNQEKMEKMPAIKPVNGIILSGFGIRQHPILGYKRQHNGVDFRARAGTPIYATGDGTVSFASRRGHSGLLVVINHDYGYQSKYAHLSELADGIEVGETVERGELIARSGNSGRTSGPHLHYEVHQEGRPVDPLNYLFADLSPDEYREYRRIAEENPMSMD